MHTYVRGKADPFTMSLAFSDTLAWDMIIEPFDVRGENYRLVTSTEMYITRRFHRW